MEKRRSSGIPFFGNDLRGIGATAESPGFEQRRVFRQEFAVCPVGSAAIAAGSRNFFLASDGLFKQVDCLLCEGTAMSRGDLP